MNIQTVAQLAGVSRSTVSYVLSGKRRVSEATRQRVMAVIDQSGYRPSATARALSYGETRTLGLIIPPLDHHLSSEQLQFVGAVAEAAADRDYDILLSPGGDDREGAFERLVGERRVDGFLLMETRQHDRRVKALTAAGFPFVTIGRTGAEREHAWVDLDYEGLVTKAVQRLHALGHQHVAFINRPQELLDQEYGPAVRALSAFFTAQAKLGGHGPARCCDDNPTAAPQCIDAIFDADPLVTAIITINEPALGGVMSRLRQRGCRIPADMSVLAVASDRIATQVQPQVTAADVPAEEMGRHAVDALLERIADPGASLAHVLLAPSFVDRGSLAPPRPGPVRSAG
jgi:DNA-binding LacI/PurR family transcriptional regulator